MSGTARCVRLLRYGSPREALAVDTTALDKLRGHEVRVQLRAIAVNPLDCSERRGYGSELLGRFFKPLPCVLGRDGSGVVVEVGQDVWDYKVGDEVLVGIDPLRSGTYCQYVKAREQEVARKPSLLSHEDGACIPFATMTAWDALDKAGMLDAHGRPKSVLVHGAGGAVGAAATQLMATQGHRVVTTSPEAARERLRAWGARHALLAMPATGSGKTLGSRGAIWEAKDAQPADPAGSLQEALAALGEDFDVLIDLVGGTEAEQLGTKFIRKGGHFLTAQGPLVRNTDQQGFVLGFANSVQSLAAKKSTFFIEQHVQYDWILSRASRSCMQAVETLCAKGKLSIPRNPTVLEGLDSLVTAHELYEDAVADPTGTKLSEGKLVVSVKT